MARLWAPGTRRRRDTRPWSAPASATRAPVRSQQERYRPEDLAGSAGPAPAPRWQVAAVCVVIAAGALVRTRLYLAGRALWYDEAAVALNVVERSYLGLLQPLDFRQTAPPLFLWAERTAVLLGGRSEWALRAPSFVAGLLLLPAAWWVCRRLLPRPAAVLATALLALSVLLVYYANEVKPYGCDALVTLLLIAGALRVAERPAAPGRWLALAVGGALALAASTPSVFVLAGVGAFLLLDPAVRQSRGARARVIALAAAWAGMFAVVTLVHRDVVSADAPLGRYMREFWDAYFLTADPPGFVARAVRVASTTLPTIFFGSGRWTRAEAWALAGFGATGVVALWRRRGPAATALVTVPVAALVAAAALRAYPLAPRLDLFAAPLAAIFVAAGALLVARALPPRVGPFAFAAAAALLLARPARRAARELVRPSGVSETREMIRELAPGGQLQQPVWLSGGSEMAWRFYSGVPDTRSYVNADDFVDEYLRPVPAGVLLGRWIARRPSLAMQAWAEAEATRIAAAAQPCVALLFATRLRTEVPALTQALRGREMRLELVRAATGAALYRACAARSSE